MADSMDRSQREGKIARIELLILALQADQPKLSPDKRAESEEAVRELGNAQDALSRNDEKSYYQWKTVALWRLRKIYVLGHPWAGS